MNEPSVWRLIGFVKNYCWGKLGSSSIVAKFGDLEFIDESQFYAELWFGTHFSGLTRIDDDSKSYPLTEWLFRNSRVYGRGVGCGSCNGLNFLFKVLSINIPLSIQLHPAKELAEALHRATPEIYRDDNHKPELVIAVTPLKLMCGLRPLSEILAFVNCIPQLRQVVGEEECRSFVRGVNRDSRGSILSIFSKLLMANSQLVKKQIDSFNLSEFEEHFPLPRDQFEKLKKTFKYISNAFPNDVGSFCIFFLNLAELQPGEAIFIPSNEPHAYISGDCVECMANSDNVVRACLTSKYKDLDTFFKILSHKHEKLNVIKGDFGDGIRFSAKERIYAPPVKEFQVGSFNIDEELELPEIPVLFLLLVIEGNGKLQVGLESKILKSGSSYLIAANTKIIIMPEDNLLVYRVFTPF